MKVCIAEAKQKSTREGNKRRGQETRGSGVGMCSCCKGGGARGEDKCSKQGEGCCLAFNQTVSQAVLFSQFVCSCNLIALSSWVSESPHIILVGQKWNWPYLARLSKRWCWSLCHIWWQFSCNKGSGTDKVLSATFCGTITWIDTIAFLHVCSARFTWLLHVLQFSLAFSPPDSPWILTAIFLHDLTPQILSKIFPKNLKP